MRLSVKKLSYRYSAQSPVVLNDLSFEIDEAAYWCVAGPNGSGKSTLLKLVCGLLPLEQLQGEVSWNGRALNSWSRVELARSIAFVPGTVRTQFSVTVADFVLQGRYARSDFWSRPTKADKLATAAAIERVSIEKIATASLTEISAGETQLALIARAIAQEPKALVLDETTANLDLMYQGRIFELLRELNQGGVSIILVSHDLNLAAEFCPNALWLKQGRLFEMGAMAQTLNSKLLNELYNVDRRLEVAANPFTSKPKIFWK